MTLRLALAFVLSLSLFGCPSSDDDDENNANSMNVECPEQLESIDCVDLIDAALVLDGQVMNCPGGIEVSASLTLERGSRLETGDIEVTGDGSIQANGAEDCPITLTSAEATPAPGDWSFWIHPSSDTETTLTWTVIEYAGEDAREAIETTASEGSIAFDNVTISNTSGRTALDLRDGTVTKFSNVSFSDVEGVAMEISPDSSEIVEPNISIDAASVDLPFVHVRGTVLEGDVEWEELSVPYLMEEWEVAGNLLIKEGANVLFPDGGDLRVRDSGRLTIAGTSTNPVIVESASDTPAAGDWDGIIIASGGDALLSWVEVRHGGGNNQGALSLVTDDSTASVGNCTFADNLSCDINESDGLTIMDTTYTACP